MTIFVNDVFLSFAVDEAVCVATVLILMPVSNIFQITLILGV